MAEKLTVIRDSNFSTYTGPVHPSTLSDHANDAAIAIPFNWVEEFLLENGGAKGLSVADILEPQQISTDLYIGGTTPRAKSEVAHWHPDQTEVYVLVHGSASVKFKYRWEQRWSETNLSGGEFLIVNP